jgi:hypothetical protein
MERNIIPLYPDRPAEAESAEVRARRECIALDQKVTGANRELAQWLIDNPTWTAAEVSRWLDCHERRIQRLRVWAKKGFPLSGPHAESNNPSSTTVGSLKTNDNFQDDDFEPSEDVEDPAKVLSNILHSINRAKAGAEAYRKILKVSSFDREAKAEIYNAITQLIVKWKAVRSTLDKKGQGSGS